MPRAEILSTQAIHTLRQLHAELAGKIIDNKLQADRLRLQMQQVEAVMKLLDPAIDIRPIAVRRRKPNPWFKRGTVYREAINVLRTAEKPLTGREITWRMLQAKGITDARPEGRATYGAQSIPAYKTTRVKVSNVLGKECRPGGG